MSASDSITSTAMKPRQGFFGNAKKHPRTTRSTRKNGNDKKKHERKNDKKILVKGRSRYIYIYIMYIRTHVCSCMSVRVRYLCRDIDVYTHMYIHMSG